MKTTNKEVVNKLQAHILDSFTQDFGWDNDNAVANLVEQISSMRIGSATNYTTAKELVMGGTFLCYHYQVREFLDGLGINPEGKEYDSQKSWDLYVHLLAREISKLVNSQVYA